MKELVALFVGLMSTQIFAQNFQIGPHLGHINLERRATNTKSSGDFELEGSGNSSSYLNSTIQGVRTTYGLGALELYSDLDMARFHVGPQFQSDLLKVAVGTRYPVLQVRGVDVSVFGGLNYAYLRDKINVKDDTFEGEGRVHSDFKFHPFSTVNVEVGFGLNYKLLPALALTADYKYADSLLQGTRKVTLKSTVTDENGVEQAVGSTTAKSKVRTRSNELLVGALWSL